MQQTTVLVTGASGGIGAAICRELVAGGCRVIGTAREVGRLDALGAELGEAFHAAPLDLDRPEAAVELLEGLPAKFSAIDVLVNNAGHDQGGRRRFDEGSAGEWCAIIETNVLGTIRMTHALIPGMLERGGGQVINLGSIAGLRPYATGTAYVASKYAVHGFSDTLRLDYAGSGLRVTEIMPGLVRSGFAARRLGSADDATAFYDGFEACLAPADVAATVRFAIEQPAHVEIAQLVVLPVGKPEPGAEA